MRAAAWWPAASARRGPARRRGPRHGVCPTRGPLRPVVPWSTRWWPPLVVDEDAAGCAAGVVWMEEHVRDLIAKTNRQRGANCKVAREFLWGG